MTVRHLEHDWFPHPLPPNVVLGAGTWLYSSFAFRHYHSQANVGLQVGHDTGLYHGTFFDLGPQAEVRIGNYCSLVGAIVATNGRVEIGDYALLAHEVVIAPHAGWVPLAAPPVGPPSPAPHQDHHLAIGNNVWIGARATLLGSVRIGENAIIGAATVVTHDVPANAICAGHPARIVGHVPPPASGDAPRTS